MIFEAIMRRLVLLPRLSVELLIVRNAKEVIGLGSFGIFTWNLIFVMFGKSQMVVGVLHVLGRRVMKELIRFVFLMIWVIPALPGLIEQGRYEESLQKGEIG
jgi:hypothetical protein